MHVCADEINLVLNVVLPVWDQIVMSLRTMVGLFRSHKARQS